MTLDLDWGRFEKLEEPRQGGRLTLWVQLAPRIEKSGTTVDASVDGFPVEVPREDWLAVVKHYGYREFTRMKYECVTLICDDTGQAPRPKGGHLTLV